MPDSSLCSESARVLRGIFQRGTVSASELISLTGIPDPKELHKAVLPLIERGLVHVSGMYNTPDQFLESYLSIRPSAVPFARLALSETM